MWLRAKWCWTLLIFHLLLSPTYHVRIYHDRQTQLSDSILSKIARHSYMFFREGEIWNVFCQFSVSLFTTFTTVVLYTISYIEPYYNDLGMFLVPQMSSPRLTSAHAVLREHQVNCQAYFIDVVKKIALENIVKLCVFLRRFGWDNWWINQITLNLQWRTCSN